MTSTDAAKTPADPAAQPTEDLTTRFEGAAKKAATLVLANHDKLELYALYKQATLGDLAQQADVKKPGAFDVVGKLKHEAWAARNGEDPSTSKQLYSEKVESLYRAKHGNEESAESSSVLKKAEEGRRRLLSSTTASKVTFEPNGIKLDVGDLPQVIRPKPSLSWKLAMGAGLASIGVGMGGFLATCLTWNKKSAGFLGLSLLGCASSVALLARRIKKLGLVTLVPPAATDALLNWTIMDLTHAVITSMDFEAYKRYVLEAAPLFLVTSESELNEVVQNVGTVWRRRLTSRGLIRMLVPPGPERTLLLGTIETESLPEVQVEPKIPEQKAVLKNLAIRRATEARELVEAQSKWLAKLGKLVDLLRAFIRHLMSSSSEELIAYAASAVVGAILVRFTLNQIYDLVSTVYNALMRLLFRVE